MDTTLIDLAIRHLDAALCSKGGYAYFDDATQAWWASSAEDLERLGAALKAGTPDAYSLWCSATSAEQLPDGWEPGEPVRPCQCSQATGATGLCGYQADARLAWLPEHLRATHRAARAHRPTDTYQARRAGWLVLDVCADHVEGAIEEAGEEADDGLDVAAWVRDDGRLDYGDA
jgi:hypothetical protein